MAPCAALGLSLVLPYGYACALTRALPVRSLWAVEVCAALLILCAHYAYLVGLPSACPVGPVVGPQWAA